MNRPTPIATEHGSVDRILHHAALLLAHGGEGGIDPILELENAVYSCWSFQIDVPRAVYEKKSGYLYDIEVTAEDLRASTRLPPSDRLSPNAFRPPGTSDYYGPGKLVERAGREAATRYTLDWMRNGEAYSILVGDIAATVARWRLSSENAPYNQLTRTVPDERSWHLYQAIGRWKIQQRSIVPDGMNLQPGEAVEYLRHIPAFTDALNALLAFDSHTPTAVLPTDAPETERDAQRQDDDDGPAARAANLSTIENATLVPPPWPREDDDRAAAKAADLSILEDAVRAPRPSTTEQKTYAEENDPGRSPTPETARLVRREPTTIAAMLKENAELQASGDAPTVN